MGTRFRRILPLPPIPHPVIIIIIHFISFIKVRKAEFIFADLKEKGCDCIVTVGGVHSNHARTIAAAARELGVETHLILFSRGELVRNNNNNNKQKSKFNDSDKIENNNNNNKQNRAKTNTSESASKSVVVAS